MERLLRLLIEIQRRLETEEPEDWEIPSLPEQPESDEEIEKPEDFDEE